MAENSSIPLPSEARYGPGNNVLLKVLAIVLFVYGFILSITLLGIGFKLFGTGLTSALFKATANPLVALAIGILGTVLVQSSSTTTSLIVGMVGAGTLPFGSAVPMVMGANVGTSITNTLVSLAHISRSDEFKRAFAGSTVHDFFNICSVIVLLPLQVKFNIVGASSHLVEAVFEGFGGLKFSSPLKLITKPVAEAIAGGLGDNGYLVVVAAIVLLLLSLRYLVKTMKSLVLSRIEQFFQRYVFRTPALGFILGIFVTVLVQSSSITTSVVVPLLGAGVLTLQQIYPYTLGANIGTTITAFLASFATGSVEAVAIAFAHLIFNCYGIIIFWPLKVIPITLAKRLSELTLKSKLIPAAYILVVFVIIPGAIIWLGT
jgi:sodium-dependent phosphate cotransporter